MVAIGNFDGVHRGHRAVLGAALGRAEALGAPAIALTFEPHPRRFLRPDLPLFRLTDERTKLRLLAGSGLKGALVLTFDRALASLSAPMPNHSTAPIALTATSSLSRNIVHPGCGWKMASRRK